MNIFSRFSFSKNPFHQEKESVRVADTDAWKRYFLVFASRNYGWTITLVGILIIAEQIREHLNANSFSGPLSIFYIEVIFVVFLLSLVAVLIRGLFVALEEKTRIIDILHVKHNFIQQISVSQDIPEVSKSLVRLIALIVPSFTIDLYIHEPDKDWFIRVNQQGAENQSGRSDNLSEKIDPHPCRNCLLQNSTTLRGLESCQREDVATREKGQAGYCLPLVYGSLPVGLLFLNSQPNQKLSVQQTELLENLSVEMSHAIGMVIEKKAREEARLTEKIHTLQLDIARDLHDTVGQNIGYLRMRLDHLSEINAGPETDLVMEIRSMSKVANESYDLVRGTLAILQAQDSSDINYLFSRYADQVAERSGFKIEFSVKGTPKSLSAGKIRQLFYIFREAISNIEKHAAAGHVQVDVIWDDKNLDISISDDGRGYDLARTQKVDIHYGLKFMRERASLLNGSMSIRSTVGAGTTINIRIPYD